MKCLVIKVYCVLNCERGELPRFLWDDSIVADLSSALLSKLLCLELRARFRQAFCKIKALLQICEMLVTRVYCVLNCERGFAKPFYKTKALSQTCEMLVSRVNCVMDCERGFAKFCIVPDLRMFVLKICCVELWARLR